jgi:hypothetical protein
MILYRVEFDIPPVGPFMLCGLNCDQLLSDAGKIIDRYGSYRAYGPPTNIRISHFQLK